MRAEDARLSDAAEPNTGSGLERERPWERTQEASLSRAG